jgi:hypothetical protein
LVHRLGKTDKFFKHKYKTTDRSIRFSNDDFYKAVSTIKEFGHFIFEEFNKLIETDENDSDKIGDKLYSFIELFILDEDAFAIVSNEHTFMVEDHVVRLRDITLSVDYEGASVKMKLHGSQSHIKHYFKLLRGQEKIGTLRIESKRLSLKRNQSITEGDIKKVEKK